MPTNSITGPVVLATYKDHFRDRPFKQETVLNALRAEGPASGVSTFDAAVKIARDNVSGAGDEASARAIVRNTLADGTQRFHPVELDRVTGLTVSQDNYHTGRTWTKVYQPRSYTAMGGHDVVAAVNSLGAVTDMRATGLGTGSKVALAAAGIGVLAGAGYGLSELL